MRLIRSCLSLFLSAAVLFGCLGMAACSARASSAAIGRKTAADPVLYGDVNGDGERDMKDVLRLRRFIARLDDFIDEEAADVNRDGSVDMKDVLCARRCIAGLEEWPVADVPPESWAEPSDEPSGDADESADGETSEALPDEPSGTSDESPDPSDDTIIYDADVSAVLTLSPGRAFITDDIAYALELEWMTHGVDEGYILTVQGSAETEDLIYPILLGPNNAEAWPSGDFDRNFRIGQNGAIFGTIRGSVFQNADSEPTRLFFYSENGSNTLTVTHITIQVIRGEPTAPTTLPTTAPTQPTASPTLPEGLTRVTGDGDYTLVGNVPYITFRSYGDEGALGVWWWGTQDALNEETCETYLDFLYMNGVDEIYFYGYYWCERQKEDLHAFIQKANVRGMVVSLLYDDADTIAGRRNVVMTRIANNYLNYCAAYPADRLNGIHFDVEGVTREKMVENMISQFEAARARGVKIAMDIACGWRDTMTYNGVTGIYNIIADNIDVMSLMSYRDTADQIWRFGSYAFAAAKTYGTKIFFGVETGDTTEGAHVDFSAESKRDVCVELAKVYRMLADDHPTGGYGISIHHVRTWYALRNN